MSFVQAKFVRLVDAGKTQVLVERDWPADLLPREGDHIILPRANDPREDHWTVSRVRWDYRKMLTVSGSYAQVEIEVL